MSKAIKVSVTVDMDGQVRTFATEASTDGDLFDVAHGVVTGIAETAHGWVAEQEKGVKYPGRVRRQNAYQNA